jgi:hypothetical protein
VHRKHGQLLGRCVMLMIIDFWCIENARVAVENCSLIYSLSTRLEQSVLFGVKTYTFI